MKRRIIIGPGTPSVLLVAVLVTISILALLSASSAHQDEQLSDRVLQYRSAEYALAAKAQERLLELDKLLLEADNYANEDTRMMYIAQNLPSDMQLDGARVSWTQEAELGRSLYCEVELLPMDSQMRYAWRVHAPIPAEDEFGGFEEW